MGLATTEGMIFALNWMCWPQGPGECCLTASQVPRQAHLSVACAGLGTPGSVGSGEASHMSEMS